MHFISQVINVYFIDKFPEYYLGLHNSKKKEFQTGIQEQQVHTTFTAKVIIIKNIIIIIIKICVWLS